MKELSKRYNFQDREKFWQNYWEENCIYKFDENSDKEIYSVDTPPPYVSADHLHAGHIMSYSQAEFIVRYKRMRGYNVYYPMGFDDNGLPTERFVEKKYTVDKSKISRSEFIKLCLEETKIGSQTYRDLWTHLGVSVDWSKVYSTIDPNSQKISQESFVDLYERGLIEHKEEPTNWCPTCQTAIAQCDLEDKEENSVLNYIKFGGTDVELIVATTRPELLGACVGLFVNPKDNRYSSLIGQEAIVPIFDYKVPIMSDESVDEYYGTGLMMVCTWGDIQDIIKWKKFGLETRSIIDSDGNMNKLAGKYKGKTIKETREDIIEELEELGYLEKQEDLKHVLNVHERCDTPAEFIKNKQWFIKILHQKKTFLEIGKQMNRFPKHMKRKYEDRINGLQWDWCISRERYYGVPIPIWYCKECAKIIVADKKDLPVDPLENKPNIDKCPNCGCLEFIGEKDVLDTWATSSNTPDIAASLIEDKEIRNKMKKFSLRPQAFEIIRTWLFFTVVKANYQKQRAPFDDIMISGHGLDQYGRKLAKRLGNFVDPEIIIKQYGADSLRYWASGAGLGENIRYNEDEIKKGWKLTNKLWNASKFCFGFLKDLKETDIDYDKLDTIDKWILDRMEDTISRVTKDFDTYAYGKARNIIDEFFWDDFCDMYIELVKYRMYKDENADAARKVLYKVLLNVLKLYAPIIPFITEELYSAFFIDFEGDKSIHVSKRPETNENFEMFEEEKEEFNLVLSQIKDIRKYRSENNISLGAELETFKINSDIKEDYCDFIKKSSRIKELLSN